MDELDDLLDPGIRKESSAGGSGAGNGQLPNANAILTLGILSIVGCFLYFLPGLICGLIALSLYGKDKRIYSQDPTHYANSFKNAKAGLICAIIGTSLSGLFFLILMLGLVFGSITKF